MSEGNGAGPGGPGPSGQAGPGATEETIRQKRLEESVGRFRFTALQWVLTRAPLAMTVQEVREMLLMFDGPFRVELQRQYDMGLSAGQAREGRIDALIAQQSAKSADKKVKRDQ